MANRRAARKVCAWLFTVLLASSHFFIYLSVVCFPCCGVRGTFGNIYIFFLYAPFVCVCVSHIFFSFLSIILLPQIHWPLCRMRGSRARNTHNAHNQLTLTAQRTGPENLGIGSKRPQTASCHSAALKQCSLLLFSFTQRLLKMSVNEALRISATPKFVQGWCPNCNTYGRVCPFQQMAIGSKPTSTETSQLFTLTFTHRHTHTQREELFSTQTPNTIPSDAKTISSCKPHTHI